MGCAALTHPTNPQGPEGFRRTDRARVEGRQAACWPLDRPRAWAFPGDRVRKLYFLEVFWRKTVRDEALQKLACHDFNAAQPLFAWLATRWGNDGEAWFHLGVCSRRWAMRKLPDGPGTRFPPRLSIPAMRPWPAPARAGSPPACGSRASPIPGSRRPGARLYRGLRDPGTCAQDRGPVPRGATGCARGVAALS